MAVIIESNSNHNNHGTLRRCEVSFHIPGPISYYFKTTGALEDGTYVLRGKFLRSASDDMCTEEWSNVNIRISFYADIGLWNLDKYNKTSRHVLYG